MTPEQENLLRETHRLALDNNKVLRKMRRNALLGGILKFIFYVLVFVIAPIWLYSVYLAPLVQSMQNTEAQVQLTNQKAQSELQSLQSGWQQLVSKIPGFGSSTQSQ